MLVLGTPVAVEAQASAETAPSRADSLSGILGGTVRGRFEGTARALAYAVVEVRSGAFARAAVADSLGRYVVRGLPAGEVRVRATSSGHEPLTLTVLLPPADSLQVDLELRARPTMLAGLDVVASAERDSAAEEADGHPTPHPELEVQALDLGPGVGQPGLLDAVRALPGNDPADATDVLFMRGSTTDLKLVLLNGVPVHTPFHVGGLLRSFEPTMLSSADLHVGGAPARYDGGLTHILDLQTRTARRDRARFSGSVDLLSASLAAEVPLGGRAGAIVSGRSLHDLGTTPLGGPRPYGYRDLLVAIDGDPREGHEVAATGFWNEESVRLDFDGRPDDATWSNGAASVTWRADLGAAVLDLTAGASAYEAALPLQPSPRPGEPTPPALRATAGVERARLVAEATWDAEHTPVRTGLSFEEIGAAYEARNASSTVSSTASTTALGAYVDITYPLGTGVTLRAGMRGDVFGGTEARVAPRATLFWEVGPEALVSIAAGRYHQPTRAPTFDVDEALVAVAEDGATAAELLPVATADHVVLSLDQRLGERVSLGLEGFWKRYEGLETAVDETIRSSGVDLRILRSGDAGVAWLGYGLSWFWSTVDLSGRASDFAGRHLLSAGVSGQLFGPFRGEARIAYGAGLPYTTLPFGSSDFAPAGPGLESMGGEQLSGGGVQSDPEPIVSGLDEEFLRVDLEIQALFEPRWGGRPWRVRPYLRLLNALDRRDALFYTFQQWRPDAVRPLAERPFLPLVGVAFSF